MSFLGQWRASESLAMHRSALPEPAAVSVMGQVLGFDLLLSALQQLCKSGSWGSGSVNSL